ncbi:MAG: nucleotidyl transferase AbiEii/AbiGii toxin family protein [Thermoleophilia bacterium]|nr:nucleotidyl transferase AbiEii/AbiGii toxin family protein [Thermoleophilia bacterium]
MNHDAADIFRQLQARALARGLNTQQQLELYVHERLLARIAVSEFAPKLALKGGMLLAALDIRDVTRDADIAATSISNDPEHVERMMRAITSVDLEDGVAFDVNDITITAMREDDQYHGLRIRIPCTLHTARLVAQVDTSFGDPVAGHPREIPSMLGAPFILHTYSVEAVLAEKLVTMIARGDANTRDRDFGDVWLIGHQLEVDAMQLVEDIRQTADHRTIELRSLADTLGTIRTTRQAPWQRYRIRTGLTALPAQFDDVLDFCIEFADPILGNQLRSGTWNPAWRHWT